MLGLEAGDVVGYVAKTVVISIGIMFGIWAGRKYAARKQDKQGGPEQKP